MSKEKTYLYEVDFHYGAELPTIAEVELVKETQKTISLARTRWGRGRINKRQNYGNGVYELPSGFFRTRQEAVDHIVRTLRNREKSWIRGLKEAKELVKLARKEFRDSEAWHEKLPEDEEA